MHGILFSTKQACPCHWSKTLSGMPQKERAHWLTIKGTDLEAETELRLSRGLKSGLRGMHEVQICKWMSEQRHYVFHVLFNCKDKG
jgi:hypothetical protein